MGGSGSSRQALALGEGRPVGMRDVAEMAGVSIATVSRFINDPSTLSTDMRAKVDDAIKQLGYIRHGAARALSMRRSHAIGAIIPTVDNATRAGKVTALQKQCRERDGTSQVFSRSTRCVTVIGRGSSSIAATVGGIV